MERRALQQKATGHVRESQKPGGCQPSGLLTFITFLPASETWLQQSISPWRRVCRGGPQQMRRGLCSLPGSLAAGGLQIPPPAFASRAAW